MLTFYNSLTKKLEAFRPLTLPRVTLYTCGPTVYDFPHIGHGRKYVIDDILKRMLTQCGYQVTHVQNITDVGHLVSDADSGEDKMEKGARKSGKTVWEVARFFEHEFNIDMGKLNILPPDISCRATEHVADMIALVQILVEKGYAYETDEAVYFDVTKFKKYDKLFGQSLEEKAIAVRAEVRTGEHKKHPADFTLWFKRVGRFADHQMHWDSPWGDGFPGWHIECSAMSMKYLGETIDIHTGGVDHLSIHHPNEIAQSECATGKPFARYFLHYNFLTVDGAKMSKSLGNIYRVEDIVKKGFDPLDLRYFYLTAHYRKVQNFTFEGLAASQSARIQLVDHMRAFRNQGSSSRTVLSHEKLEKIKRYQQAFVEAFGNDLNTPQALAVVWEAVKSNIPGEDKYDLLASFDQILGLGLTSEAVVTIEIPEYINALVAKRNRLRSEGNYQEADHVRETIGKQGFILEDSSEGTRVVPKR